MILASLLPQQSNCGRFVNIGVKTGQWGTLAVAFGMMHIVLVDHYVSAATDARCC